MEDDRVTIAHNWVSVGSGEAVLHLATKVARY